MAPLACQRKQLFKSWSVNKRLALNSFVEENIEVYHTHFKPLEWNFNWEHEDNSCYTKIIVNKADNERVAGFHYLGSYAGEVI